jgi:dienelactone hydrolase
MVSLTSGPETAWKAGVQSSPGRIDPADAAKTTIPIMMLASKDEPAADVKAFSEALTVPKHIETFDSQIHGWMSARADLEDEVVKKEFQRGYELAIKWFEKYI